jgi:hypothetical protein
MGTRVVPVRPPPPVLDEYDRPAMKKMTPEQLKHWKLLPADVQSFIIKQNDDLQKHSIKLETTIKTYNTWAEQMGKTNDEYLGIRKPGEDK